MTKKLHKPFNTQMHILCFKCTLNDKITNIDPFYKKSLVIDMRFEYIIFVS